MSNALDPLRRLVVQFSARIAHFRAIPANLPPPAHLHVATAHATRPLHVFGQFQVKVPRPSHKDGPLLLTHLNRQFNTFARNLFVPEPVRVAAVDYACQNAGRPQIASLLSRGSLKFSAPHGFVKNVGIYSTRGFSSGVVPFQPALNGPVKMMAQMYAKPLVSLPAHSQKLSEMDRHPQQQLHAKKKQRRSKAHRKIKKHSVVSTRISSATIKAFLNRATLVEQQHLIMAICNVNAPITTATAISLAKVAGKTVAQLEELPKLNSSDLCLTNVDMCFMLDSSPLWHLDTLVSALHTDSLREPKELNRSFIENLLEITNAQYQHFLEVAAILGRLVKCPETREIKLEGYELRVHFEGTTLSDMTKFLTQLSIDPKSPRFDLKEIFVDPLMTAEQYFPQASVNEYYTPSLSDNETWDDCSSLVSSLMYADSEGCSSVASFATMESMHIQQSPWEGVVPATTAVETETKDETEDHVATQEQGMQPVELAVVLSTDGLFLSEESVSPWNNAASTTLRPFEDLAQMSSRILNTDVTDEYFDDVREFLESIGTAHIHSNLFGASTTLP
ncbi:hypothetical protein BGZ65_003225 [Modicella reniformis]|uniref:Uncharacterized protein n=1 Tax=Modicella reniformis TaxID=1440133 RepID=A0A9P6M392_9FUNG|nr:hypothetical protein BGZ65_003225 [Modicella reniformis]